MGKFRANFDYENKRDNLVKQIQIILILSVVCFWGKASNNVNDDFHGDIKSLAEGSSLKF